MGYWDVGIHDGDTSWDIIGELLSNFTKSIDSRLYNSNTRYDGDDFDKALIYLDLGNKLFASFKGIYPIDEKYYEIFSLMYHKICSFILSKKYGDYLKRWSEGRHEVITSFIRSLDNSGWIIKENGRR
jgi:hypothetical protein